MTKDELIKKYNPANAGNLTEQDLDYMRNGLTDDELDALATAYPNDAHGKPYLLLFDNTLDLNKQIYPPSTWQNLRNVRKYSNQLKLRPYTFRSLFVARQKAPALRTAPRPVPGQVVDLSATDAAKLLREATGNKAATGQLAGKDKPAAVKNPPPAAKSAQVVDLAKGGKGAKAPAKGTPKAPAAGAPADQQEQEFGEGNEA